MRELILYLITFIVAYLFYLVFVFSRKNVLKKFPEGKELSYLKYKYGVKVTQENLKRISNCVFLANAFILSTTVFVVSLFNNIFLEILVGLVTLISIMLLMYHLIGTYYKKKQERR